MDLETENFSPFQEFLWIKRGRRWTMALSRILDSTMWFLAKSLIFADDVVLFFQPIEGEFEVIQQFKISSKTHLA
jgi:hypothetical protein